MPKAKLAKSLNSTTLSMNMECFGGPKGSKMKPKWCQNGPSGGKEAEKKRKESREAQKVLSSASWERSGTITFDFGGPQGRVGGVRDWVEHI